MKTILAIFALLGLVASADAGCHFGRRGCNAAQSCQSGSCGQQTAGYALQSVSAPVIASFPTDPPKAPAGFQTLPMPANVNQPVQYSAPVQGTFIGVSGCQGGSCGVTFNRRR